MKRILLIAIAISVMSAAALAQSVNGTWTGEAQGRGGVQQISLTLDGASGTWVQGEQETEVSEVASTEEGVSFQRTVNFGGRGAFALSYSGVVDGNEMTLTVSFPGRGGGGAPDGGGAGPGGGARGGRGAPQPIVLTRQ